MITRRKVLALTMLLACAASPSHALGQQAEIGSRVRVLFGEGTLRGQLAAVAADSLLIRPDGYRVVRAVCACDVTLLEVSEGRQNLWLPFGLVGAAAGAIAARPLVDSGLIDDPGFLLTGLAIAAAIVLLPAYPLIDDYFDEDNIVPITGAVVGAGIGIAIGLHSAGDRWRVVTGRAPASTTPWNLPAARGITGR
jgi:hypothetical protein